ncbi:dCTP deaminase domain-containing protein [Aulosira sp. FACHB-615]|uniref:dCTP deaminase domain-containing protein n=1 Tax=Aulosira sp. FACHB-615 TaxID=2692777 RepID=UPI001689231D|nr:dCTP deaminase [Aulosira sp. FACHB-615]
MIKNDKWITEMAQQGMISPFEPSLIRKVQKETSVDAQPVISYGLSSYGYDIRLSPAEFRIFRHIPGTVVDPKNFNPHNLESTPLHTDVNGSYFILPAHSYGLGVALERLEVPDNITVVCIGKSTYARCFRGDTRVALVDGTSPTLEEMAERSENGEKFWGYSIGQHGRIIVTLLENPRYIGRDSLLEVTLDNNESIFCTPDHLFMTRDGRMVEAHTLKPQDSLMPLYRQVARGYEMVYQPLNGHLYPTHRLSDEWNLYYGIYENTPNTHRHHVDFNRLNNNPWNIVRMDASAHIRLHNQENYGDEFDPDEHGESIREAFTRLKQNADWNAMFSQQQKEKAFNFWHDAKYEEIRQRVIEGRRNCSDDTRQAHRDAMIEYYKNPTARALTGELSKQAWAKDDGTRRYQQSQLMKQLADASKTRHEITADVVRSALDQTGSIRGAARLLNCDRSVFRRFPEVIQSFRGLSQTHSVKNHKVTSVKEVPGIHDVYCLTVPEAGNFALEAGVFVHNCGIIANLTPAEAAWRGHLTLEFSNSSSADCRIYANEGVVQLLFLEGEPCAISYEARQGKYQDQLEIVTIARV